MGVIMAIIESEVERKAKIVLATKRVAVFIVAYNAANHIESVFQRIPKWIASELTEIFLIDDSSSDTTVDVALKLLKESYLCPVKIFKTPSNQGYGGNQKIGYSYSIDRGFDIVVLLHGDGQYAPEILPEILAPYADGANAVFGSRFLNPVDAIKGGMPYYKFVGNRILTFLQNLSMNAVLSEWHSGYRSYSVDLLKTIPFESNSNGFDFDSDIIIQWLGSGYKIFEVPIPTYYGNEICYVNGMEYARKCIKNAAQFKIMQLELMHDPKFDLKGAVGDGYSYTRKEFKTTLHSFIRRINFDPSKRILDLGGGDGRSIAQDFVEKGNQIVVVDRYTGSQGVNTSIDKINVDLDSDWGSGLDQKFDVILALDVLEHLKSPETSLKHIKKCMGPEGILYASTGNVAFFPVRLMLLLGFFNYGRKGILDLTHTRLFTRNSFSRLLSQGNFEIKEIYGFGPPIADLMGKNSGALQLLDIACAYLAKWMPSLFAYQILIVAKKRIELSDLVNQTTKALNS
jgi:glycosyltransferase involved in cell wall biosynthesis